MASEVEELRAEIETLKDTVSELISEHNMMSCYIEKLRGRLTSHYMFKWYRFIMWIWPMELPGYEKRIITNRFRKRDRRPVLRSESVPKPRTRDRAPKALKGLEDATPGLKRIDS
jgi:hypothetical protein